MKKLVPPLIILSLFLSSCSKRAQIYDVVGTNTKNLENVWVFENDTLKLSYDFWAQNGTLSVTIFNKINKPIYIDWKKSSFIHNSNKYNFWTDELNSTGTSIQTSSGSYLQTSYRPLISSHSVSVAKTKEHIVKPERITFIPPKSQITKTDFSLLTTDDFKLDVKSLQPLQSERKKNEIYYQKDFTYQDSPLKFRNFIAYSLSENSQVSSYIDNDFFLSSIRNVSQKALEGKYTYEYPMSQTGRITFEFPLRKATSFYILPPGSATQR